MIGRTGRCAPGLVAGCIIGASSAAVDGDALSAPIPIDEFESPPAELSGELPVSRGGSHLEYLREAEAGDRRAQSRLGVMYRVGRGVEQDDAQAFRWLREAALAGDPAAQHYIGLFYLSGVGTEIDLDAAALWLRRCAEINEPEKLMSLAWFSLDEHRMPHGAVHAAALLRNLAEQGHAGAQYGLGVLGGKRDDEVTGADVQAWLREAAQRGHPSAQLRVGMALLQGEAGQVRAEEGVAWLVRAAEQGNERAMRNLGVVHFTGRGVPKDAVLAYQWFWLASQHGSETARHDVRYLDTLLSDDERAAGLDAARTWERERAS